MREQVEQLLDQARQQLEQASRASEVRDVRTRYLGRRGEITGLLRQMSSVAPEQRPLVGQMVNQAKEQMEALVEQRLKALEAEEMDKRLADEKIDITLPGLPAGPGTGHVLVTAMKRIEDIFLGMGFSIAEGPEIESDDYNFIKLNIPPDHPARDMQDTFYVDAEHVLRTHTSPVQLRAMLERAPQVPLRVIAPGRVYRRDPVDATHLPNFTQVEGLAVDRNITFGDLKGVLEEFARSFFDELTVIRMRPSYFPFTEPSAEVDVSCTVCMGEGCRVCGHSGWLEVLGAGMVHPQVLENGGYDPGAFTGFAFGMGVERLTMLKYGIDDLRHYYQNDQKFLRQFRSL